MTDSKCTPTDGTKSNDGAAVGDPTTADTDAVSIKGLRIRTRVITILVIALGFGAAALFLAIGIPAAQQEKSDQFAGDAAQIEREIQDSWKEYEAAGLWIHQACRSRDFSREDFRGLYHYLKSGGLAFQAAEFIPNITHAEREASEKESLLYYQENYPWIDYNGYKGLEPDPENSGKFKVQPRTEQPFYFPVHYVEPVDSNAAAIDFDLYSSASRRETIHAALETWKAALTRRLKLVQETDPNAYSVLLMHPGIPVPEEPSLRARDVSLMVIRVPDLLERASKSLGSDLKAYIFDTTLYEDGEDPEFLGGIRLGSSTVVDFLPEIQWSQVRVGKHHYEAEIAIASTTWTVIVQPVSESDYAASLIFVVLGGAVIVVATLLLAYWIRRSMRKTIELHTVLHEAAREKSIVSSLFPSTVRDRLLADAENKGQNVFQGAPIADLFPNTTIMLADLVGFTAWSSVREPAQVFSLLETIYHSFDVMAKDRDIFKVETVGDCYVAVAGLPDPMPHHASVMAQFAEDCIEHVQSLVMGLEKRLGPGTGDLDIRVGLHSGPVVAGVLRGDKGRFQLFGDTINTASRMESTGEKGKVHMSQETASLLQASDKADQVVVREDPVTIKGKGVLKTYWLKPSAFHQKTNQLASKNISEYDDSHEQHCHRLDPASKKMERLIEWMVEVLAQLLVAIVARRNALGKRHLPTVVLPRGGKDVLSEVEDVITLPELNRGLQTSQKEASLSDAVDKQLRNYVSKIASLYNPHPFHNFEHASHVTMSVTKLLSRIVSHQTGDGETDTQVLHDSTYGINSDPLTQFACAFSALIHDCAHPGVPNATLVTEKTDLSLLYHDKSIAEQNSVDIAWNLLMSGDFDDLRRSIYCDDEELSRFRQLVVNSVMATDICDKNLGAQRKARWSTAFDGSTAEQESHRTLINRKATIVIEHLIQASDVCHTMQHWQVYISWNQKLFREMRQGFVEGRLKEDPANEWYQNEIAFFDYYVVPLAKKLKTCGVFGVSSEEYLSYAEINRAEWITKGKELVEKYLAED